MVETLAELTIVQGVPEPIRPNQDPEFVAKVVQEWITRAGVEAAHIEKASPWENGRIESFRSKLRHELIDREIVYGQREAPILIETSRIHDNMIRPHSVLGERARAPEVGIGPTSPLQRGARPALTPAPAQPNILHEP